MSVRSYLVPRPTAVDACAVRFGGLVAHLDTELKVRKHLAGQYAAGKAMVLRAVTTDHAAPAAEDRPILPILFKPQGQENRGVVGGAARTARHEQTREEAHVEAEAILMQEAIFRGNLDIARAELGDS